MTSIQEDRSPVRSRRHDLSLCVVLLELLLLLWTLDEDLLRLHTGPTTSAHPKQVQVVRGHGDLQQRRGLLRRTLTHCQSTTKLTWMCWISPLGPMICCTMWNCCGCTCCCGRVPITCPPAVTI